ncbi:hypothetical protein I5Q34_31675 [Streptomyces sp. AV19]|nr:hypothetical protein [Streptomyces sp. AV19]MBH1938769.1 hypothetical protein [Streptomyces sp. AV19]MDG4533954.1 hypothetical protein [Streptomyces sp. AV19]
MQELTSNQLDHWSSAAFVEIGYDYPNGHANDQFEQLAHARRTGVSA